MNKTPMTQAAASRIQSATAKSAGQVGKGSFTARAQSAAAKNASPAQPAKK
jgi:Seed maturation protein